MVAELESKLKCWDIVDAIIDRVFDVVESIVVKPPGVMLTNGSALKSVYSKKK